MCFHLLSRRENIMFTYTQGGYFNINRIRYFPLKMGGNPSGLNKEKCFCQILFDTV